MRPRPKSRAPIVQIPRESGRGGSMNKLNLLATLFEDILTHGLLLTIRELATQPLTWLPGKPERCY